MNNSTAYEVVRSEGYQSLKLSGAVDADIARKIETDCLEKILEKPLCDLVINCEDVSDIGLPGIRTFMGIQRKLKEVNKQLRLICPIPAVSKYLNEQGVSEALISRSTLRAALVDFGLVTAKSLDVNFINPFLTATMNVLKIQASTDSKAGQLYKRDAKDSYLGDISGIIGLVSEAFNGAVVISFPEATFLKIISRMLGEEYTSMNKDIQDGAGELTNIIFGQAKVVLNEKGYGIRTAIPSVVTGKDHSVQNLSRGPRVTIPFTTDVGDFFIEVCLSE